MYLLTRSCENGEVSETQQQFQQSAAFSNDALNLPLHSYSHSPNRNANNNTSDMTHSPRFLIVAAELGSGKEADRGRDEGWAQHLHRTKESRQYAESWSHSFEIVEVYTGPAECVPGLLVAGPAATGWVLRPEVVTAGSGSRVQGRYGRDSPERSHLLDAMGRVMAEHRMAMSRNHQGWWSRSRGRAQADDEDSMDATDVTPTPDVDISLEMDVVEPETDDDFPEPLDLSPRDERPLSPLFQRSVSEDSAGSSASTTRKAKTREKLCAFCYCGEKSLLGQGELKLFGPTPGYVPLHIQNRRGSSEKDDDYHDDDNDFDDNDNNRSPGHRGCGLKKVSSPDSGLHSTSAPGSTDPAAEEPGRKFWDELGQIGLPDDINVASLFDPTGQCCAHLRCAAWSEGVCRGEGQSLLYVDKAIDSGSTECCAYCKRLGASIKCCEESCGRSFHYPCAAAAGTFQDIKAYTLLCPDHIQRALVRSKDEVKCLVCDSSGDLLDQLFCCTCGQHYHGACLDITVTPLKRAGWQCPECKVCLACKNPGDDSKMLVCDMCDKGYHTYCLQPVMDTIPTNGWRCKNCRTCAQCGMRPNGQWSSNGVMCEGCQQQHDSALVCLICGQNQDSGGPLDKHSCCTCKRWVHVDCERREGADPDTQVQDGYTCRVCKQVEEESRHNQPVSSQEALFTDPEPAEDVFMAVEEVNEAEEEVALKPEARTSPLPTVPEKFLSSAEPAQEIQVTVTLTEGSEPPPCTSTLVGVPSLSFQATSTTEDHNPEHSLIGALEMGKETEDKLPDNTEDEPEADVSKALPALPTKETSPKHSQAQEEEPMDVCPSDASSKKDKSMADVPETQSVVEEIEHGQKEDKQEHEEEKGEDPEVSCVLPEPDSVPQVAECSPTVEMDTTPVSDHSFSSFSSPIEDKSLVLKHSPGLSSEGSTKLTQSPFSTEASPREMSQSQTPTHGLNLSGYSPSVSNTTFFPLTPKIGMGKPAISKRKFSPGRPRVKQGAWSNRSAMSSPSWSPERSDAWDSPKTRPMHGLPIWTMRLGRGSGFPGRRRPRGANLSGRGGRGRSRLKTESSPVVTPGVSLMDSPYVVKEEEENSMHNTVVLFSTSDSFTLKQDMCVVCGSFGQGAEGRLLACSQCGQCYHPFCVNIKITKVVLSKGWRCLECTVCEACGQATDPGRLLLCDDCDISYHTYCLDPPLQNVPKGSWKCKWCVLCTQCGATSPGQRCEWQNNYTQCGPCASLTVCPVCTHSYREEELILQCRQCDRWVHASCQGLNSDEEVESAADEGFDCSLCRTHTMSTPGGTVAKLVEISEPPAVVQVLSKVKENEFQRTYTQDGVCLTESGLCQLQSLCVQTARRRRPKPKLKLKIINQNSVAVLQTPPDPQTELFRDGDMEDGRAEAEMVDGEGKSDSSPEREVTAEDDSKDTDPCKKRKRKPYRPGGAEAMECEPKLEAPGSPDRDGGVDRETGADGGIEGMADCETLKGGVEETEDGKKRKRKPYRPGPHPDIPLDVPETKTAEGEGEQAKKRRGRKKSKLEDMFPAYLQEAFFGKTLLDQSKRAFLAPPTQRHTQGVLRPPLPGQGARNAASEPVEAAVRPTGLPMELKQEGEGSKPPGDRADLPQGLEGQDSQQFFRKVLGPTEGNATSGPLQPSIKPVREGLSQSPFFDIRDRGGLFSPDQDEESPWATPSAPATPSTPPTPTEPEGDGLSYNQRSLQRWEKDEELGNLSTISPVLYANMNFPSLKQDYPDWASRCKQIMKIWRKVSAADKVPYLQKAKDNRAAQRINKAQKQAESQVCRPIKTEPGRIKGERPNLHLQIPPPSGSVSTPSQPSSAESPYPLAPDSASSAFFPDGPLKTPCSADVQTDPFSKLPSQSPHLQSQPSTPYSQPSSSPLQASSSGYPMPGPQGATQGRPANFGSLDMQPGTPRRAQQVDPFFKSQQQIPKPQQLSQEALGPPESPRSRPGGPGDSQMFSPPHTALCGDPYRGQHGASRQDHASSPSPSAIASSPAAVGQNRAEINAPSPRSSFGRQDLSSGSPASLDCGDGLFKAPMTPRMHQGDAGGLSVSHPPGASPNHPPESYRQSPSTFSDPYAQPPLTPRPQSGLHEYHDQTQSSNRLETSTMCTSFILVEESLSKGQS
ncbi:histone-lysine N-methyltransferase 2C-like [Puntigrus tetrazona]|uniref:histone-lysine N-methyltransferase 2C-like n=1 Tax=Puntigrus tetrazona TaxID=1606681 RepID=UPI001C89B837|nr:histone-lysine N-methyltransferase 2C-like [Puntigrus tetrazona]